MTYNNNNMDVLERAVEQIEELRESIFEIMKYHGCIHNIKDWNLFNLNDELFIVQEKLIRHKTKVEKTNKIYIIKKR